MKINCTTLTGIFTLTANLSGMLCFLLCMSVLGEEHSPYLIISKDSAQGVQTVDLSWTAESGGRYFVEVAGNISGPWRTINEGPINAKDTIVEFTNLELTGDIQYFKIVRIDSFPPSIVSTSPLNGSIGNNPEQDLIIVVEDHSEIDMASLNVTGEDALGESFILPAESVSVSRNMITISPWDASGRWGESGENINLMISLADVHGNSLENFPVSFGLKQDIEYHENMVLIGGEIIEKEILSEVNKTLFTIRYSGSSAEIQSGATAVIMNGQNSAQFLSVNEVIQSDPVESTMIIDGTEVDWIAVVRSGTLSVSTSHRYTVGGNDGQSMTLFEGGLLNGQSVVNGKMIADLHLSMKINNHKIESLFVDVKPSIDLWVDMDYLFDEPVPGYMENYEGDLGSHAGRIAIAGTVFPLWLESEASLGAGILLDTDAAGRIDTGSVRIGQRYSYTMIHNRTGRTIQKETGEPEYYAEGVNHETDGNMSLAAEFSPTFRYSISGLLGVGLEFSKFVDFTALHQRAGDDDVERRNWYLESGAAAQLVVDLTEKNSRLSDWREAELINDRKRLFEDCFPADPDAVLRIAADPRKSRGTDDLYFKAADQIRLEVDSDCLGSDTHIQWFKDGRKVPGGVGRILKLEPFLLGRQGTYYYQISDRRDLSAAPIDSHEKINLILSEAIPGEDFVIESIKAKMIWIEPGTFLMGSPLTEPHRKEDEGQHEVTITRGYWLGEKEINQEQYGKIMGAHTSHSSRGPLFPVNGVRWQYCIVFGRRLTDRERESGAISDNMRYTLPSEAQWEFACRERGAATGPFHYGDTLSSFEENFNGQFPYGDTLSGPFLRWTTQVGSYWPNALGLYDMHGNVSEFCFNPYGPYPDGPATDPGDPSGPSKGSPRVVRGGNFLLNGSECRSAVRQTIPASDGRYTIGFRISLQNYADVE